MNRRDMIIVATLINAGLLVAVFISAVNPKQVKNSPEPKSYSVAFEKKADEPIAALETESSKRLAHETHERAAKILEKKLPKEEPSLPAPVLQAGVKEKKGEAGFSPSLKQSDEKWHTVRVEKGDVLERIARHHGVSVEEIVALNHLPSYRLQIGQTLKLPVKSKVYSLQRQKEPDGMYYTVKGGDNPWTIAHRNGMQVEELLELNNMDEEKAKRIKPGDKLKIK